MVTSLLTYPGLSCYFHLTLPASWC